MKGGPRAEIPEGPRRTVVTVVSDWFDRRFFIMTALPAVVVVTAVTVIPILLGIWLSFTNYQPLDPTLAWAGLVNYRGIISGPNAIFTHAAIKNTLIFAGGGIVVETLLGVIL